VVRGIWFIATRVTLSSGVSRGITTSASIRWIRPSYTYPDESSRVVVYCFKGRNMLVWRMYDGLWICFWLHWWCDFMHKLTLLLLLCAPAVWYSYLRWSSTCWCEQRRGTPVDNREMVISLHSPRGLHSSFLWAFI